MVGQPDTESQSEWSGRRVAIGKVSGLFGVRGWLKVYSYTSPRANIVAYSPWVLRKDGSEMVHTVVAGQAHGDGIVAQLAGIVDRETAALLVGSEIEVDRATLGPPPAQAVPGEYFWFDLHGMEVSTASGKRLGVVDHLVETGANDVMVVVGEARHLVPFVYGSVVLAVDTESRRITVDWDAGF
ncbi:MAG: ribosome maturation factor RimM [Gammaproteobacteria bacterium]